jgi:uncharacterized protein YjbI with pentapeptide repeats
MPDAAPPTSPPTLDLAAGDSLSGLSLDGALLEDLDLSRVRLGRASLRGATLRRVKLSGATLRQVDLQGATLEQVDLSAATLDRVDLNGARVRGLRANGARIIDCDLSLDQAEDVQLCGARMSAVSVSQAQLADIDLRGARIEDSGLFEITLERSALVGLHVEGCELRGCVLEGCDLGAATLLECRVQGGALRDCRLDGALLRRPRIEALQIEELSADRALLVRGWGVDPASLEGLVRAGLVPQDRWLARSIQRLRHTRHLRPIYGLAAAGLVLGVGLLTAGPSVWPDTLLLWRLSGLQDRQDVDRCLPLRRLGELALERRAVEAEPALALVQEMAQCQLELGEPGLAVDLLQDHAAQLGEQPEAYREALLAAGEFQLDAQLLYAIDDVVTALRSLEVAPEQRLDAYQFEARLAQARGISLTPGSPDRPVADEHPWLEVHLGIAETLKQLEHVHASQLGDSPTALLVMGRWSDALAMLEVVQEPALDTLERWGYQQRAVEILLERGEARLALAMLEYSAATANHEDLAFVESLAARAQLHRQLEQPDQALAMLDAAPHSADPLVEVERALLHADVLIELDHPAQAAVLLEGSPANPSLGFQALSAHSWMLARARLLAGDEERALAALEPMFEAVPDTDRARLALLRLAAWSEGLHEPTAIATLLDEVDNPVVRQAGDGQEIALTILRAEAIHNALSPESPSLHSVLEHGTAAQALEAAELLVSSARRHGSLNSVLDAMVPGLLASEATPIDQCVGLALAQGAVSQDDDTRALALLETLSLARSELPQVRAPALQLAIGLHLRAGDLEAAQANYRAVLAGDDAYDLDRMAVLGRRLIDALDQAERGEEALALTRELRELVGGDDPALWLRAMTLLIERGDQEELDREIELAAPVLGRCGARVVEAWAIQAARGEPTPEHGIEQTCTPVNSSVEHRVALAGLLGEAKRYDDALYLLRTLDPRTLVAEEQVLLLQQRARWLEQRGDEREARALLAERYGEVEDPRLAQLLTEALMQDAAEQGDPDEVIEIYTRFAADHPMAVDLPPWRLAALALIELGESDRLDELEGKPSWQKHVQRELARAEFEQLVEQGSYEGAWRWVDGALGTCESDEERIKLLHEAYDLADRSGDHGRLLGFLGVISAEAEVGGALHTAIELRGAEAMESQGQAAGAAAMLSRLLQAGISGERRAEVLAGLGRNLGQAYESPRIEEKLAEIGDDRLSDVEWAALRVAAARVRLEQGEPGQAQALLTPLQGQQLQAEVAEQAWDLLAHAQALEGRYDEALQIPDRYPSQAGSCGAWLALVTHLPPQGAQGEHARELALGRCDPLTLDVPRALTVARVIGEHDPRAADGFLARLRSRGRLSEQELATVDAARAEIAMDAEP